MKIFILSLIYVAFAHATTNECRFAPKYSQSDLLENAEIREQFLGEVLTMEAKFMKEIGYDQRTGLTLDGQPLDVKTGLPYGKAHQYTASSKESLHVAILAKVLNGDDRTQYLYTADEALEILKKKISTYEEFAKNYPAYGGFLPWMHVNETHVTPEHFDWTAGIPSLDNGQLFWAAYGLTYVLGAYYPNELDLFKRWTSFYETMIQNSVKIFHEGNGNIRQVAIFENDQLPVDQNNYTSWIKNCSLFEHSCYLDDPYEGELFTTMMFMFAQFENETDKELIWTNKRAKLQAVDYFVEEHGKNITVQTGWWFSAHEQWKYFFLPYLQVDINKRVFINGEKLRTWDARQNNLPGMFASVTATIKRNEDPMNYMSDCGIPGVAFSPVGHRDIVTPYSTMALFLADEPTATVWYHNMISGPAGQTQYGSVESLNVNGTAVAPLGTWDSKATTVLGMLGGLADIVDKKLTSEGYKIVFYLAIQNEWSLVFENHLNGEDIPFALPNAQIPKARSDFTSCSVKADMTNFAWGTATAAYQVEGAASEDGRGSSIWDDFCKIQGTVKNGETGDVADDFYHKYKQDVAMMKNLGVKHFRMSFSWSRLLPTGRASQTNQKGIDFYNSLIDELIAAGITPWVTLYHWDMPSSLSTDLATGGWLDSNISDYFNEYADFCFKTFGAKVKKWLTINEPWTYCWEGYGTGKKAPGRCSDYQSTTCKTVGGGGDSGKEPYTCAHNSILAHAKATQTYKATYQATQGGEIGFTTNVDFAKPYNSSNPDDVEAVNSYLAFAYGWFVDPIVFGKYPDEMTKNIQDGRLPTFTTEQVAIITGAYDYIGLNHYTTSFVKKSDKAGVDWSSDKHADQSDTDVNGTLIGPYAESSWLKVYPQGIRGVLNWVSQRYNSPKIYIFENGVSVPKENEMGISDAVHDSFRVNFYKGYIQNVLDAINHDGVNVQAYFAWSLMDNFEWQDGYSVRFGMTYVDYANSQQRWLKDSAIWYSQFIKTGTINGIAITNPYDSLYQNIQFLQ